MKSQRKTIISFITFGGIGAIAALIFAGGFLSYVQYTNTMEFCISCHEMESTVYQEYQKSVHYSSKSGVRPNCADCHVPKGNWIKTLSHKVLATRELVKHIFGTVDTTEKFEARRLELAQNVWDGMKEDDSANCRGCHNTEVWDLNLQKRRAKVQHEDAVTSGETCIDCHKGIAHKPIHKQLEEEEDDEEGFDISFSEN